jgi:hypothetical protein
MRTKSKHRFAGAIVFLASMGQALHGGNFDLSWFTVDCGGGSCSGGQFSVSGTFGQPDAGPLTGGAFKVEGGFWSGVTIAQTPGAPILKIHLAGPNAVLSWPVSVMGFTLQESTALSTGSWTNTPQAVVDTATEHTVTVPAAGLMKCFRLKY